LNTSASAVIACVRQGAKTQQANACKDEQRSMARRAQYWSACSVLTQKVKHSKGATFSIHAMFKKKSSGQLPFLGLRVIPHVIKAQNHQNQPPFYTTLHTALNLQEKHHEKL